jgi:hypothetical protein
MLLSICVARVFCELRHRFNSFLFEAAAARRRYFGDGGNMPEEIECCK